ncbi:hypothetical protein D3C80_1504190 [compost metagenome]
MEVGCCQRDVAKRCSAEHVRVIRRICHRKATLVGFRQNICTWLLHQTERIIPLSANIDAAVARGTTLIHKDRQSLFRFKCQRSLVAVQIGVERCRRNQGCLKRLNRLGEIVEGDRFGVIRESCFEPLDILRHRIERCDHLHRRVGHLDTGLNRTLDLRLQVIGSAIPKLRNVENRIEYSRRISRCFLPAMTD